jgi:hypothetical protein
MWKVRTQVTHTDRIGLKTLRYLYETPPAEGFNALYYEAFPSHQR